MTAQVSQIHLADDLTEADLEETKAALMDLNRRLIHVQEEERARIASELHDDVNQRLALLANGILQLKRHSDHATQKELRELWQLTSEIASDLQHLSHQLHPAMLRLLGLAQTARKLCQDFTKQCEIEVSFKAQNIPADLKEDVALSLFRTLQESLRNVAKHSNARQVTVELSCGLSGIHLRISDDGVGFDPHQARSKGLGLVSMRERLRSVGGEFTIFSRPSIGTEVDCFVPLSSRLQPERSHSEELQSDLECRKIPFTCHIATRKLCKFPGSSNTCVVQGRLPTLAR